MNKPYMITLNGVEKPLREWAKEYGRSAEMVYNRITKNGWDPIRALTTPKHEPFKYKYKGEMYTIMELAQMKKDLSESALRFRIARGSSIEEAMETPNQRPTYKKVKKKKGEKGKPEFCCHPDCDNCPYSDCRW